MIPTQPTKTRRASLVSWLGVVGMVVAGIVVGLVVVDLTAAPLIMTTEMSDNSIFAVFSLETLVPAVALWLTRNRYWRGLAVGLTAVWLLLAIGHGFGLLLPDGEPDFGTGIAEISDAALAA